MKLRILGAKALRQAMPMVDTIEAVKSAYAAYSSGAAVQPQRMAMKVPPGRRTSWMDWAIRLASVGDR